MAGVKKSVKSYFVEKSSKINNVKTQNDSSLFKSASIKSRVHFTVYIMKLLSYHSVRKSKIICGLKSSTF